MRVFRLAVPLILVTLTAFPALAGSIIEVVHPRARPTMPNRPGAAYCGIHNTGDAADRLIAARAEGVGTVELHKAEMKGEVMTMAPVEAIEVPAGGMAHLAPGGFHLMLFDIETPLKEGDSVEITLIFEGAGEIAVTAPVQKAMGDMQHQGHQMQMQHQHQMQQPQSGTTGN